MIRLRGVYQIYCLVAEELRLTPPSQEQLWSQWGKEIPGVIAGLFGLAEGPADVDEVLKVTWQKAEGLIHPLFPGTKQALEFLSETGLNLGILSTSQKNVIRPHLESAGVLDLFNLIIGGDDTSNVKPHPSVFEVFLKTNSASRLAYVGDALVDWEAARDAGLGKFLAVTTGHTLAEEFLEAGVPENQILQSAAAVPQVFKYSGIR